MSTAIAHTHPFRRTEIRVTSHAYARYVYRVLKGQKMSFDSAARKIKEAIRRGSVASRKFLEKHSVQPQKSSIVVVNGHDKWIYLVETESEYPIVITVLMRKNWRHYGNAS